MSDSPHRDQAGPPYRGIDLDEWDVLENTDEGKRIVAMGMLDATSALRATALTVVLDTQILARLHEIVFEEFVPEFAGRFRGPASNQLALNVSFGQHRGTPYDEVPGELERLSAGIGNLVLQLDELQQSSSQEEIVPDVLTAAAWTHCELARIHPFPNGNGRVSRLAINYFCYRYGLLPIALERPRGEYIEATRAWLYYRKIEPLADLLTSLVRSP